MNQIIKTTIDGVPVEIEITKMGPATAPEINKLETNLSKEDKNYVPSQQITSVNVVRIGTNGKPATEEEIAKVKAALKDGNIDITTLIQNLANSINTVPAGKDFWASKVVWINFLAIVGTVAAYFGFDFKAHNIDPEIVATLITTIVGILNLYYRKGTSTPLNNVGDSVRKIMAK